MRSLVFEGITWATYEQLRQKDRVIYQFNDRYVYIFAIGGHYDQKP
ncbi:hypothetical protein [Marinimicrobium sp. ARAG 43.8]